MAIEPRQLYNFIQGSDISGESAYDIWKNLGNEGSEADFLEFIRSGPKGEKGDAGESAYSYFLDVSANVMKKSLKNVLLPETITFRGFYRNGSTTARNEYSGRFIIRETTDGTAWQTTYTSSIDEPFKEYMPSSNDVKIISCTLYSAGGTTTELDMQTVVVLTDVENLEIGARNILSNSDITYNITKESEPMIDTISIVDGFDLQSLIGKKVTLSYYADTIGDYINNTNKINNYTRWGGNERKKNPK